METYACERRSRIETAVHSDAFVHSADIAGTTGGWSTVPRGGKETSFPLLGC